MAELGGDGQLEYETEHSFLSDSLFFQANIPERVC